MKSRTINEKKPSAPTAPLAATEELSKYNELYMKKEQELREINLKRLKNLEVLLQAKEEEILRLKNEAQRQNEQFQIRDEAISEAQGQLSEYEAKFSEIKDILVEKNEKIEELEKTLEEERSIVRERLEKARVTERSLLDKCAALHEEIKSMKWKHDQDLRNLNLEIEEYKHKIKLVTQDKDELLHSQRSQLENILRKELANKENAFNREKADLNKIIELKTNENMRLGIENSELGKVNETLRTELNKIKAELAHQKQSLEIQSIEAVKKASDLQTKLITLEKENEFSTKSRDTVCQDLAKKLEQQILEKQGLEVEYRSLKEKFNVELECKEETRKLELEKITMRYTNTIKRLEQSLDEKNKEIDQLLLDNQGLKQKISELERKLMLEQSSRSLNDEKKNEYLKSQLQELNSKIQDKENEILRYTDKNSHLEVLITGKNEEIRRLRMQLKELEGNMEALQNQVFKLKNNRRIEQEEYRLKLQAEFEEKLKKVSEANKKLAKENEGLKKPQRESKRMIPFLEEPYEENVELGPEFDSKVPAKVSEDLEEKKARILELEAENNELKAAIEDMREEMEKIKNELMDDMKGKKDTRAIEKRLSLELGKAKLREKEAEMALRDRAQQDEMMMRYKGELQKKENEVQQMQKALEGMQGKMIMLKAERDKLIDISNSLRVELNKLKKQQSPKKEAVTRTYKTKLEKLKQDYNNLDQLEEDEQISFP